MQGVSVGLPVSTAAGRQRVPARTVYRWLARGRASVAAMWDARDAGLPEPERDEPYHTFAEDVDQAWESAEAGATAVVIRSFNGPDGHKSAMWWLERARRHNWSAPAKLDVVVGGDPAAPIVAEVGPGPDLYAPLERLRETVQALAEAGDPAALVMAHVIETTATD